MPATGRPARPWSLHSDGEGLRAHRSQPSPGLLQIEAQQAEHQANQLRAQAKQCLIKHEFRQAEQLLSQGLQLTPGAYKLLRLRSVAYACLQQYIPSLKDAEQLVTVVPGLTDGYYHKGFALYHLDDYAGAAHSFQQALNLNPGDRVLRQGFWDAVTLMSQHRRDDVPVAGAPQRTTSVAPTLAKLHEQKLAAQALAEAG
ncbi:Hsp90 cochaperone [Trebouxia sp. C0010 RCD-2024]